MENRLERTTAARLTVLLPALTALLTLGALIPYLLTARYALPFMDDFWFYNDLAKYNNPSALAGSIAMTIDFWAEWQGAFTTTFFNCLFSPLQFDDYYLINRVELIALMLLGLASLALFLLALCGYIGSPKRYAVYFGGLFLLPFLSYEAYTGVYLWYTGAMAYLLPAIFLLLALALLLYGRRRGRPVCFVFSAVLAFLTSGCSLEAAGLGCATLLLLLVLEYLKEQRLVGPFFAVFLSALAGALLNALAPGNFVRHEEFGGGLDLFGAALNSLRFLYRQVLWLLGGTSFPVFLVLALLLGVFICKRLSPAALTLCGIAALATPVITIFPVLLGYNWNGESMANRSMFLFDASIEAWGLAMAALLGSQLSACGRLPGRRKVCIAASALAVVGMCLLGGGPTECKPVVFTQNLLNGSIEHYSSEWRRIYDYVADYGEGDVVVTIPVPEETAGCAIAGFTGWIGNQQNTKLAEYYGVDSVRLSC